MKENKDEAKYKQYNLRCSNQLKLDKDPESHRPSSSCKICDESKHEGSLDI